MSHHAENLWTRSTVGFPRSGSLSEQISFLVGYAVLAPSGHNTQPWLFRVGRDTLDVLADRTRSLPVVDPADRELTISCGAAIGMLEVAARRFGLATQVTERQDTRDPDHLARVEFAPCDAPKAADMALFEAIQKRRTNRTGFDMVNLPEGLVERCRSVAADLGASLAVLETVQDRKAVAALVAEGDRLQFDDPAFRKELAQWVRSSRLGAHDGMSGASFGMPDILSAVGGVVIRTFDMGGGVAASDAKKIVSATPALMVLASPADGVTDWLRTGRALARILLELTSHGFSASYLNQPIETTALRPGLKAAAGLHGFPQILLRVGQAASQPDPTARRDLAGVIQGGGANGPGAI